MQHSVTVGAKKREVGQSRRASAGGSEGHEVMALDVAGPQLAVRNRKVEAARLA